MKAILDTNVLIYALTENPYKKEVKEKLTKLDEVYIPLNVLMEFVLVCKLKLKVDEKEIYEAIEEIKDKSILVDVFLEDFFKALEIARKYNSPLSEINDLILIPIAKRLRASLFTYDKKLKEIARKENVIVL